jgi:flagellar biosynthesis protein
MAKSSDHTPLINRKAVAVKQTDPERSPQITAKGKGFNAEKILDIAFAEGVKVRQDSELTDILEQFEINSPIPLEALHTVSLILEKVYSYEKRDENHQPLSSPSSAQEDINETITNTKDNEESSIIKKDKNDY